MGKKKPTKKKNIGSKSKNVCIEEFEEFEPVGKHPMVLLNEWEGETFNFQDMSLRPNVTYAYNRTLDPIKVSSDLSVPMKIYDMRKAAEVHRQVRRHVQESLAPGMSYLNICETLENKTRELFGRDDKIEGIGFPTGFSVNNIAAHDSANPGDTRVLSYGDVVKIDFGTHVNGNIIDSAFTVAFDPKFESLLQSTKDGTWTGIRMAGPDALINEISADIKEAIESYEIELDGKTLPIHAITNLGGHTIEPYTIHAGKLVLGGPSKTQDNIRMSTGECFAIETFATTGDTNSIMRDVSLPTNHYMKNKTHPNISFSHGSTRKLYNWITEHKGTLPFCTRWLTKDLGMGCNMGLRELVQKNVITPYEPLITAPGTYTSQWEHTIYLHDYGKEVLSYGEDY
jgi:methionyl aminopeptidase